MRETREGESRKRHTHTIFTNTEERVLVGRLDSVSRTTYNTVGAFAIIRGKSRRRREEANKQAALPSVGCLDDV